MFNYTENQNDATIYPNPNNYCGGYALDAVLHNRIYRNVAPLVTYNQIQLRQNNVGAFSTALIAQSAQLGGGTRICLPSSIVFCLRYDYFLQSIVYYAQNVIAQIPQNVIDEETARLGVLAVFCGDLDFKLITQAQGLTKYWIVLVNNGGHWIAIKREDNDFYGYDPAGGHDEVVSIDDNKIHGGYINYVWSGICIAIN